jgi:hypothetical protein
MRGFQPPVRLKIIVTIILTLVPDNVTYDSSRSLEGRLPEASRKVERVRCSRADLQSAPGRLGHHVSRHDDRGGRCFPGLGQAKAGNARSDHVPGSLA